MSPALSLTFNSPPLRTSRPVSSSMRLRILPLNLVCRLVPCIKEGFGQPLHQPKEALAAEHLEADLCIDRREQLVGSAQAGLQFATNRGGRLLIEVVHRLFELRDNVRRVVPRHRYPLLLCVAAYSTPAFAVNRKPIRLRRAEGVTTDRLTLRPRDLIRATRVCSIRLTLATNLAPHDRR
jgi:hypothetical protein